MSESPEYRLTHSRDGYALGSANYPDNREGRRALARSWKRTPYRPTPTESEKEKNDE